MQSVEFNTKLLKLHLQWPERESTMGTEDEALEFFKWLFVNYHDRPEVEQLQTRDDVADFLKDNRSLLDAKKAERPARSSNSRIEPRIENDVQVLISVKEYDSDLELVGLTTDGRTLNLGLHGMQVTAEQALPVGSKSSLRLMTEIELTVETIWSREIEDGKKLMGLKILETEEFELWRSQFGAKFVSPKIARDYKKKPDS